ncbi:MAG: hypothetical protein KC897_05090 [Candidatus Omnitrophica bacterium]|nr:hypothetical protein [Candidatus Omnitrophota bacterium]MCB9720834.1 hypothetical protein [Candidatus Omnitrophota bacterium]
MRLSTFLKTIGAVTVLALSYVHMQMQIFDLAYLGKDQERTIARLDQQKQFLTYSILSIKSVHNLGHEMLGEDSGLQFANPDSIVLISSREPNDDLLPGKTQLSAVKKNPFSTIFSFATRAEARNFE